MPATAENYWFLKRVIVRPKSRCWIWTGSINNRGYGQLTFKQKVRCAHRFSYEHHHGPIPKGMNVLHSCDRRSCVNPEHLSVGTQSRNIAEAYARGRRHPTSLKGVHNPIKSKVNDNDVRAIRSSTESQTALAARYGISQARISLIQRREAWTHVE